jgi:hypothetical protein
MKVLLVILLLVSKTFYGQTNKVTIQNKLFDSSDIYKAKLVMLIETNDAIVLTTYDALKVNLRNWILKYPNIPEDKSLLEVLESDSTESIIKLYKIAEKRKLDARLNYRIGDLLQSGLCFIYNKSTKRREKKVKIIAYGGFGLGVEGRNYYIKRYLLLDNIERVF